jgi:hypothetical protein
MLLDVFIGILVGAAAAVLFMRMLVARRRVTLGREPPLPRVERPDNLDEFFLPRKRARLADRCPGRAGRPGRPGRPDTDDRPGGSDDTDRLPSLDEVLGGSTPERRRVTFGREPPLPRVERPDNLGEFFLPRKRARLADRCPGRAGRPGDTDRLPTRRGAGVGALSVG